MFGDLLDYNSLESKGVGWLGGPQLFPGFGQLEKYGDDNILKEQKNSCMCNQVKQVD